MPEYSRQPAPGYKDAARGGRGWRIVDEPRRGASPMASQEEDGDEAYDLGADFDISSLNRRGVAGQRTNGDTHLAGMTRSEVMDWIADNSRGARIELRGTDGPPAPQGAAGKASRLSPWSRRRSTAVHHGGASGPKHLVSPHPRQPVSRGRPDRAKPTPCREAMRQAGVQRPTSTGHPWGRQTRIRVQEEVKKLFGKEPTRPSTGRVLAVGAAVRQRNHG